MGQSLSSGSTAEWEHKAKFERKMNTLKRQRNSNSKDENSKRKKRRKRQHRYNAYQKK